MQRCRGELKLVPAHVRKFHWSQAVAIGYEDYSRVVLAMPIGLGGLGRAPHFVAGQILPRARQRFSGRRGMTTVRFTMAGRHTFQSCFCYIFRSV